MKFRKKYATSVVREFVQSTVKVVMVGGIIGLGFWGVRAGLDFWNNSPHLKIEKVEFSADIPPNLKKFLDLKPGENILKIRTKNLSLASLEAFPEFEKISIKRHWDRSISVEGLYRTPVAIYGGKKKKLGIDQNGHLFPLTNLKNVPQNLPIVIGKEDPENFKIFANAVRRWKKDVPEFYKRLNQIKTDRMSKVKLVLTDGILIYWGEFDEGDAILRGEKVMQILNRFQPKQEKASLRFVEENRIVLDSHWTQRKTT